MKRNISRYFLIALTINVTPHALEATAMQSGMKDIEINQWVSSVRVGPLPEVYSTAEITLPEFNTVKVDSQQGGTFSLDTRINPRAKEFHYDDFSTGDTADVTIRFNDLPASSHYDIFDRLPEEPGNYSLMITFEKYKPNKGWNPTISVVKDH
jgi:hypothetical protein